jgi:hypothetical protein
MRHFIHTVWGVTLCALIAAAQPASRKEPVYYAGHGRPVRVEPAPGIRLGLSPARQLALSPLSAGERAALAGSSGPRLRTGVHRQLPPDALRAGAWEVTAEGNRIWRMSIHSPKSISTRVEFRNFAVGTGQVWVHDGTHSAGPYTGNGLFDDGHFWTDSIASDSLTIEYQPGGEFADSNQLPFEIANVSHQAIASPLDDDATQTKDPADLCHLDPNCYADWKPAMSMVGELMFEDGGYTYFCSGTLVATRDNSLKPYLLTAGHCIHSEDSARSLVVYWNYQTTACYGTPPTSRESSTLKSTGGGHLIDYGTAEEGDYSLVLLQNIPGGVTFSGWDPTDVPMSTDVVGIHHPKASWKRISFGKRTLDETVEVEGLGTAPGDKYYVVTWDHGRAEPGSSGSAIFTSPGVIVGTLTWGSVSPTLTVCQMNPSTVGYGRFSNTYNDLKAYFENLPASTITADKTSLRFASSNYMSPAGQTVKLSTQSPGTATYKLRADAEWITVSNMTGTVSANSPAQFTISVDATKFNRADTFSSTVTILSGAADPQYINVVASMTLDQSNVVVSITPATVIQTDTTWNFNIHVAETGGAATRITGLKFNGADYTSSIKQWFGSDHLAAKGTLDAPLSGNGRFPSGLQYFEFEGVDDATGQHWYRVATVNFQ